MFFVKIYKILTLFVLAVLAMAGMGALLIGYFTLSLPTVENLKNYRPLLTSQILARDGTIIAEIGAEKREVAPLSEIPRVILDAFLSAEDDGFYEHKGVDYMGLLRAMLVNLKAGRVVQGGSTITQQVAKSLLLSRERSIGRKIKDFLLAQKIEQHLSKEEILHLYLNQVYLGGGFYGIKAAYRGYFGKEIDEATIAESAMLAGLLVAPGRYSPYVNPGSAKKRQHYVLGRMRDTGKITLADYESAMKEKTLYKVRKKILYEAGFFSDWIRQKLIPLLTEESLLNEGYRIKTTIDYELQKLAEKEVVEGTKAIDKRQGFKGPIGHWNDTEERVQFEKQYRRELAEHYSDSFIIDELHTKRFEFDSDESFYEMMNERIQLEEKRLNKSRIYPGPAMNDPLKPVFKENRVFKASVVKIDDQAQLVYVSVAGHPGIIPAEYFSWAHERKIDEDAANYAQPKKPSEILKEGDLIWVRIVKEKESLLVRVTNEAKNYYAQGAGSNLVKDQSYLLCELDQVPEVQGSLVSLIPQTGEIVAFVGGNNFSESQFNRVVQSLRQPGSSFKPLIYAAGLENGFLPNSIILDSPEALSGVDDSLSWKPKNYDGEFKGPITYRDALEQSRNIPTIKIAQEIGVDKIIDFAQRIGFNAKIDRDLSLSLGSFGVTLLDLTTTYAMFPNGGKRVFPKSIISIVDRDGNPVPFIEEKTGELLAEKVPTPEALATPPEEATAAPTPQNAYHQNLSESVVYDPRLAYIMVNLMKGVVHHGTGKAALSVSPNLAGKTGTTNSYVDAWFVGFSSGIATGVWTGFDENKTLGFGETGARSALPIWIDVMRLGVQKYGEGDFLPPLGIVNVMVDKSTGQLIRSGSKGGFMESFIEGTEPSRETQFQVIKDEKELQNRDRVFEDDSYYNNQ